MRHLGVRIITFLLFVLSFPVFAAVVGQGWEGEYSFREDVENEGTWYGDLTISGCKTEGCEFEYHAGSDRSECAVNGRFKFDGKDRGKFVQASEDESKKGNCIVTLERSRDVITVNAESTRDTDICNQNCGWQGARYFDLSLRKKTTDARQTQVQNSGPSFTCSPTEKLTKIEKAICSDQKLAMLDLQLSRKFRQALRRPGSNASQLRAKQKAWMKDRDFKCGKARDVLSCLEGEYKNRIGTL